MLALVGIGLSNRGITLEGLDMLKLADLIYYEEYTNTVEKSVIRGLEKTVKKKFQKLERSAMEENAEALIEQARESNIAICISGDPLSATTHIALLLDAARAKVKTAVIHAPSILNAVGETGLQLYKFGRTVTVPKAGKADSVLEYIRKNLSVDLHTLVLLDIGLTANEAIPQLRRIRRVKDLVVIARAGSTSQAIFYGLAKELAGRDFGKPPHCLIIPATLHFVEQEALERWKPQEQPKEKETDGEKVSDLFPKKTGPQKKEKLADLFPKEEGPKKWKTQKKQQGEKLADLFQQ